MALTQHEAFDELLVRLQGDPDAANPAASPLGLQMSKRVYWTTDTPGEVVPPSRNVTVATTWADVLALTTTATLNDIKAALDAELASR